MRGEKRVSPYACVNSLLECNSIEDMFSYLEENIFTPNRNNLFATACNIRSELIARLHYFLLTPQCQGSPLESKMIMAFASLQQACEQYACVRGKDGVTKGFYTLHMLIEQSQSQKFFENIICTLVTQYKEAFTIALTGTHQKYAHMNALEYADSIGFNKLRHSIERTTPAQHPNLQRKSSHRGCRGGQRSRRVAALYPNSAVRVGKQTFFSERQIVSSDPNTGQQFTLLQNVHVPPTWKAPTF